MASLAKQVRVTASSYMANDIVIFASSPVRSAFTFPTLTLYAVQLLRSHHTAVVARVVREHRATQRGGLHH